MKGAYVLIGHLKKDSKIKVGSLGELDLKKGYYCYVGSARGKSMSIENRTNRHKNLASKKAGNLKWHINYFLVDPAVSLVDVKKMEGGDECKTSKLLEGFANETIQGFGSSDCIFGCAGHLHYFKSRVGAIKSVERIRW